MGGPTALEMTTLMTPDMMNFSGKVHGGALLNVLDEVAYACASRYAGAYVVTLLLYEARFRAPVHVGDLATYLASVNWVGRTSMEVGIRVTAEDPRTRSTRHVLSCFFVMVAMTDEGKTRPVPPFTPTTEDEIRRWRGRAGSRRGCSGRRARPAR